MMTAEATGGAAGPGRGGRMSRQRKRDAVLRLLRGEDLEAVSRSLGVTAATLSGLARRLPGRRRGELGDTARRRRGARKQTPRGEARRDAAEAGTARSRST